MIKHPEFNISEEEWDWAEKQQRIKSTEKENGFKIRRKSEKAVKKQITHSFVSIPQPKHFFSCIGPQSNRQELYCLSPKGQYLGKGTYGKVKLAKNRIGEYLAIKIQSVPEEDSKIAAARQYEVEIMQELGIYHGSMTRKSKTDKKEYQIIKYLGISLRDMIANGEIKKINPEERYRIGMEILKSLHTLHQRGILHCDFHSGNVLIEINKTTGKVNVSLIDFGFSKKLRDVKEVRATGGIANLRILSPEIYNPLKRQYGPHPYYSEKSDVYAAGLVLQQLGFDLLQINNSQMLQRNPAKRSTAEDALNFFRTNKKATISGIEQSDSTRKKPGKKHRN